MTAMRRPLVTLLSALAMAVGVLLTGLSTPAQVPAENAPAVPPKTEEAVRRALAARPAPPDAVAAALKRPEGKGVAYTAFLRNALAKRLAPRVAAASVNDPEKVAAAATGLQPDDVEGAVRDLANALTGTAPPPNLRL